MNAHGAIGLGLQELIGFIQASKSTTAGIGIVLNFFLFIRHVIFGFDKTACGDQFGVAAAISSNRPHCADRAIIATDDSHRLKRNIPLWPCQYCPRPTRCLHSGNQCSPRNLPAHYRPLPNSQPCALVTL